MASANNGAGFTIREMRPEDVQDAGDVLYRAFYVDSLATGVPTSFNVASPEVASRMLGSFVSQPSCYKLVAIDSEGKVVGGVLIQHGQHYAPVAECPILLFYLPKFFRCA